MQTAQQALNQLLGRLLERGDQYVEVQGEEMVVSYDPETGDIMLFGPGPTEMGPFKITVRRDHGEEPV